MKRSFSTEKYLDEHVLHELLCEVFPNEIIHNKSVPSANCKGRPDFRIESRKLILEFDGPRHYTEAEVILRERQMQCAYEDAGYRVVRIPNFVQLSTELFQRLTGIEFSITQTYPSGFISPTVVLPCNYCELGVGKFERDLYAFHELCSEILDSLVMQSRRHGGPLYAVPPSFLSRLNEHKSSEDTIQRLLKKCESVIIQRYT